MHSNMTSFIGFILVNNSGVKFDILFFTHADRQKSGDHHFRVIYTGPWYVNALHVRVVVFFDIFVYNIYFVMRCIINTTFCINKL